MWYPFTRPVCWGEGPERPERRPAGRHPAPAPVPGPAPVPAPLAPPPPSALDLLRARLDRLLETGEIPRHPDDVDLAEAVCSILWPKWPAYHGKLSLTEVRLALGGRELDERALARLGGADAGPPPPTKPPPKPPKPRDGPSPPAGPAVRPARERPPGSSPPAARTEFGFSHEGGVYLKRAGP
jgi:hypothetical protein